MSRPIPIEEMVKLFKESHTQSHLFKIDNFSLFRKHGIEKVHSSFDRAGHKWKLVVYPNGNKNAKGHVSIFLRNQSSVDVQLEYKLFVISQLTRKDWHTHGISSNKIAAHSGLGYVDFISHADLERKGYLIGDCCMFGVEFHGIESAKSGTAECISLIEKPNNHKVTWMMTKFSSFDPRNVHLSNDFVVGNRKWRIKVHPRGFKGEKDKSFSVYLSAERFVNNAPKAKTYARFKLRVLDRVSGKHVEKTVSDWIAAEPDDQYGFANFMRLEELHEPYLVNDTLCVGVDFEVISITNYA